MRLSNVERSEYVPIFFNATPDNGFYKIDELIKLKPFLIVNS